MPKKSQLHPNDPTLEPSDLNAPVEADPSPVDSKAKKPRTESPARTALRAFERRQELVQMRTSEVMRHAKRLTELDALIKAHDEGCLQMSSDAYEIFERLVAK